MIKVKQTSIGDLVPYENNARTHTDEHVEQIAKSIQEFGFTNPVLIDSDNGILAGHGRVKAGTKLGMKKVPTICIDHLTDEQKKAYILADNRIALNAGWDDELLKIEFQALSDADFDLELTGFDDDEIDELLVEEIENNFGDDAEGEIKFSEEIGEANNYIVLTFRNEIDWLSALTHFDLESVHSKRQNGKPWSKGIGRVVNGAKYLRSMQDE